jgi:hypothetical protein
MNTVESEGKGIVAIKDLQIGDKVKDAKGEMVTVYSFGHYNRNVKTEYLQIYARGLTKPIEISKSHLLFVNGVAVPASSVSVGDKLDVDVGLGKESAYVRKIKTITRRGAFAPFTTSGTVVVSGVIVSNYVTLQENATALVIGNYKTSLTMHWLAHLFQAPHRLACKWNINYCKIETYSEDGISNWVKTRFYLAQWLLQQNGVIMALLFVPALLFALLPYVLEACISVGYVGMVAAIGVIFIVLRSVVHVNKPKHKEA